MQHNVELPQVELNMEAVTVVRWLVKIGARVAAEQPILEVETQKATVEVPSPVAGFVRELLVAEGAQISEKARLCVITDTADEAVTSPTATAAPGGAVRAVPTPQGTDESGRALDPTGGPIRATPLARKTARDLGVDLGGVRGSGPGGRVKFADVQAVQPRAATNDGRWVKLSPTRQALIAQMQRAVAEIPQINITRQLDVTPLTVKVPPAPPPAESHDANRPNPPVTAPAARGNVTFTHRLVRAAAAALVTHPALRTRVRGDEVRVEEVAVAVAMDTPHGLFAPVVRHAERLSLTDTVATVTALREKALANKLKREDLSDGLFAITNLGMLGVDVFAPLVFSGQTAVLAVGRAVETAAGRRAAWFTLAVDHRVVDGAEAARFLQTLQEEILRS